MNVRTKIGSVCAAAALVTCLGALPAATAFAAPRAPGSPSAQGPNRPAPTSTPVTGTFADGTSFAGELSQLQVVRSGDALQLLGTITGTGLPVDGTSFATPITGMAVNDGCTVLDLDLGPLHLDLLGLVIDLNQINLDITAVPGAGNLLGNLLCSIAGLLDNAGGPLGGLTALLNRLLSGLGLGL
ncbi:hypothetical protein AADG42_14670 [Ammonicoccus fulvus]|uniref:ABC transporter substrate-binding protein n=1 Tax=Ammonicoccus fulvus TaxID=3138240 RepID=A0ABZ3FQX9_9ACTN